MAPLLDEDTMQALADADEVNITPPDDDDAVSSQLLANMQQDQVVLLKGSTDGATDDVSSRAVSEIAAKEEDDADLQSADQEGNNRDASPDSDDDDDDVPMQDAVAEQSEDDETEEQDDRDHNEPTGSDEDDAQSEEDASTSAAPVIETEQSEAQESSDEAEEASDSDDDADAESEASESKETTKASSVAPADDADEASAEEEEDDGEPDPCLFCNQFVVEREDGPADDDLSCAVCRRPAHRTCAQLHAALPDAESEWTCSNCMKKTNDESPKGPASKPRQSASRLVRDLLPVSRGITKPGAHSIFAQPLIQDVDDGSRALRKRKSLTAEPPPRSEKRRRKSAISVTEKDIIPETATPQSRRTNQRLVPTVRILQKRPPDKPPPHKFLLAFRLEQDKIADILSKPPRPSRRRERKRPHKIPPPPIYQPPIPKFPALPPQHLIFPAMFGDRENDANNKPYGGILSDADAETSRSLPQLRDREAFEIARKEAEEERRKTSAAAEAEMNQDHSGSNATSKRTVSGPPSKIKCIQFGKFVIDTSYAAPYPEEYSHESRLFICEFCLKYLPSEFVAWRHKLKCPAKHPPGDEIYRDGSLSIWEVDGRKRTEYCQCLCLMAKLFLGSKTLYYDVEPFLFYVLTEYDEYGYHFVGYFSKEKRPASQNNVSCILVLPIHQRKGYATFLIDFSYLLTRIEGKEGSPEKPLSDMGLTAYRSYWDLTISRHLLDLDSKPFSVKDIMLDTGMTADDVVHSLERLYAFVKDPITKTYGIRYDRKLYQNIVEKFDAKEFQKIRPEHLVWTPYIMGRSDAANLDSAPLHTVAQREEDEEDDEVAVTDDGELPVKVNGLRDLLMKDAQDEISPMTDTPQVPPNDVDVTMAEPDTNVDANGNVDVAPGPPSTGALESDVPDSVMNPEIQVDGLVNGNSAEEKGKQPEEPQLSGYALAYVVDKIPATRFLIDPPIPSSMLRIKSARKKSTVTPRANGTGKPSLATTPVPVRSSPRKAGSAPSSAKGSRATSPSVDQIGTPMRRSQRKSGLAQELSQTESTKISEERDELAADDEDEEDEEEDDEGLEATPAAKSDDDDDDDDDEDEDEIEVSDNGRSRRKSAQNSHENAIEDGSEGSDEEDEEEEESDASSDPDAEVDEEEDEDEEDEDEDDGDPDVDIPSVAESSADEEDDGSVDD